MSHQQVITIIANDRPGIIEQIAQVISQHRGNWLESSFSRLGGKFAGILLVDIAPEQTSALTSALKAMTDVGIRVALEAAGDHAEHAGIEHVLLTVVGNDRQGIVGEISGILARRNVNVDDLSTYTENAPMSGELLFHVSADIALPPGLSRDDLQQALEELSDDLMVEVIDLRHH